MAKYQVINLLWSESRGGYIEPGEVIELDDATAKVLLDGGNIKPAKMDRGAAAPETHKRKRAVIPEPETLKAETPEEASTGG